MREKYHNAMQPGLRVFPITMKLTDHSLNNTELAIIRGIHLSALGVDNALHHQSEGEGEGEGEGSAAVPVPDGCSDKSEKLGAAEVLAVIPAGAVMPK